MNTLSAADKRKARIAVLKRVLRTLAGIEHNRADMIELEQIIRELGGSTRDSQLIWKPQANLRLYGERKRIE